MRVRAWKLLGFVFIMVSVLSVPSVVHALGVTSTITVGGAPWGVAYDSGRGEIFLANWGNNTVSVMSDGKYAVLANVAVGLAPYRVEYDSAKGEVFVANYDGNSVSVISDSNNTVVATVPVGTHPSSFAYDSGKGEIFVANYCAGTLSVISDSQAAGPSSAQGLLQQVWVPKPANAAAAVAVSAVVMGAVSLVFAAMSNPLGSLGGTLAEKTKDVIPDNIREWLEEVVSSKTEATAVEKTGYLFRPTATEALAYVVSIVVLAFSFSYVKVITLDQIWALLPVFLASSVLVGFVQEYVSIVYLRSKGVWSEEKIWPLGLLLFIITTFAFKVPFSQPARSSASEKDTERLDAIASAFQILVSLAFAGLFFLLLRGGYAAIGGAGLTMCVIMSFVGTFPVAPMSGKDIFDHSRRLWAGMFIATAIIFAAWLLLL